MANILGVEVQLEQILDAGELGHGSQQPFETLPEARSISLLPVERWRLTAALRSKYPANTQAFENTWVSTPTSGTDGRLRKYGATRELSTPRNAKGVLLLART